MLAKTILASLFLATTLTASPIAEEDHSHHEIVRFKRDTVLSARDLELADMHNVNLTESECTDDIYQSATVSNNSTNGELDDVVWKHSVVKRSDGDDITIWVHNSFEEPEGPENTPSKRQSAHLWPSAHFASFRSFRNCDSNTRWDITSATSPFTGGIVAMRDWVASRDGYFLIGTNPETNYQWGPGAGGWGWRTILIGGSNSGRNARYRMAIKTPGRGNWYTWVDNRDIELDLNWTHDRRRQFDGRWRAASHGEQWCGVPGSGKNLQEFQIISFDQPV
ncbi:hypothetical protein CC79DRAFT_909506 [Sarocladium strictum]